ncbi:hypothetical protein [Roseomonas indoligenes]|uniref:Uncharacterized protein n=1 Tax=Roseomonas indoligenes TaxID=2820811 RepID=A0A940MYP3_9PROT|nr:hypothetical protein [Pararoseomonas indoligenes]MBP0495784.1 hypothetical protein [Pararoseomonas indoligenes]
MAHLHVPAETKLAKTGDGLIALAAILVCYGRTEIIHCYGFLAVFVTAVAFRHAPREDDFQLQMHAVTDQIERIAMMVLLLLFGGALRAQHRSRDKRDCRLASRPDPTASALVEQGADQAQQLLLFRP